MRNEFIKEIRNRGITRLCHFTRSSKALHILSSEDGVVASDFIDRDLYDPNDEYRYDGRTDCVNCSIQYPNTWYYNKVKDKDPIFNKWVVLYINPSILMNEATEFCFTNAAFRRGACISGGIDAFKGMFAPSVAGNRSYIRTDSMLLCCPTDDQAEVLIYKNISREDILAIAVPNEKQAKREVIKLYKVLNDIPKFDIIISSDLFSGEWSRKVRQGIVPYEYRYDWGE